MPSSKSDWISSYRQTVTKFIAAINEFEQARAQYDALDYSNTLVQTDFGGSNVSISVDEMKSAVASAETLITTFKTGHNTIMYGIKI